MMRQTGISSVKDIADMIHERHTQTDAALTIQRYL
jgi:hypothetical protein